MEVFNLKKSAHPYEHFKFLNDHQQPVDKLIKEDLFSKLKNAYLSDKNLEGTEEFINLFIIRNEELTEL